ncbi:MAG: PaaX family transcriptional regulator [Actinomycetes bacterium]
MPESAPTARPRSLILTVYGAFLRELGGWVAIADLITLLQALDVDGQAVRSSISRLKRRGALEADRRDGATGYALSAEAQAIFAEGDRRIFGRSGPAEVDAGWVLAVFSVPEAEREKRHVLRSRLTWLGYGNTAAGVWVAPAHLLDDTRATLRRLDLDSYVHLFRAEYAGFAAMRDAVRQWWDLDALQRMYGQFVDAYGPVLHTWQDGGDPRRAFRDYALALTEWRRLPFLDPGLPGELLPEPWAGTAAAEVFQGLRARLWAPGMRHVQDVTGLKAGPR